mmetsp:Transcript_12947/g.37201  ORF Transcript_12947/g.37201 Transcript_12947/m.37201 type:complete len:219 (+) Transcript_12947:405-1061(+)
MCVQSPHVLAKNPTRLDVHLMRHGLTCQRPDYGVQFRCRLQRRCKHLASLHIFPEVPRDARDNGRRLPYVGLPRGLKDTTHPLHNRLGQSTDRTSPRIARQTLFEGAIDVHLAVHGRPLPCQLPAPQPHAGVVHGVIEYDHVAISTEGLGGGLHAKGSCRFPDNGVKDRGSATIPAGPLLANVHPVVKVDAGDPHATGVASVRKALGQRTLAGPRQPA